MGLIPEGSRAPRDSLPPREGSHRERCPAPGAPHSARRGSSLKDGKIRKLDVKKGDRVLLNQYAGTEVNVEGEEHLILREDDVLGVLK